MFKWKQEISRLVLHRIRSNRAAELASEATARPGRGPVRLREVEDADFSAVAALKMRHRLASDSPANWQRLWKNNPVIEGAENIPMGWVLEGHEGIVGYHGNIRLRGFYRGKALKIAAAHGFVVEPGYRLLAGRLVTAFLSQKGVDLVVSTSAIESSGKILQLFKAQALPQVDYDVALFWVLNAHGFLREVQKRLGFKGAVATFGTHIGSWVLRLERALRGRGPDQRAQFYKIDAVSPSAIDDDFDALWRRKLAATTSLITDRSAAVLRWHFDIPGDQRRPVILRCDRDGRLAGYVVVLTNVLDGGLRKASIADMLVESEDSLVPQQLLIAAFKYARQTQHDVLELLGFPDTIRRICSQWNPYVKKLPAPPYLFKANNHDLHNALGSADSWYATPYDGDATLIPRLGAETAPMATDRHQSVGK